MTRLKFYRKESELFKREEKIYLTDADAKLMIKKLARHYGVQLNKKGFLKFRKRDQHGTCFLAENRFSLSHNPNVQLICHEFAHLRNYQKLSESGHTKVLMSFIKKSLKYALSLLDLEYPQTTKEPIKRQDGTVEYFRTIAITYTFKDTIFKTMAKTGSQCTAIQLWQNPQTSMVVVHETLNSLP